MKKKEMTMIEWLVWEERKRAVRSFITKGILYMTAMAALIKYLLS